MTEITRRPRRHEEIELLVEELDARGGSIGFVGEHRFRLRGAAVGDRVRVRVGRKRHGAVEAYFLELIEAGPFHVEGRCPHRESCGGCSFQSVQYDKQLEELGRILSGIVTPLRASGEVTIAPVHGCEVPWAYRNKMDFTFGTKRWIEAGEPENAPKGFAVGLHVPGRFDKVLDIGRCEIAFPEAISILDHARRLAKEQELTAWDVRAHVGLLRNLVVRKAFATGEILVDLVTTEEAPEQIVPYLRAILASHPEITTIVQNVNSTVAVIAMGEREILHHGPGWIHEEIGGRRFRISANSFFQTNSYQAELLARIVRERAGLRDGEVLFDLYCGGGFLSLLAGPEAREVWGFELVAEAIEDARRNATLNGLDASRFVAGDLVETLSPASLEGLGAPRPDVCLVDPPRAGMHASVVEALAGLEPRRIVYVSCNPRTAVDDIALLLPRGYALETVEPVDLFPHTPHLECVFTLERRAKD
jgi:23S rRNA (uracil1939-C5)-methyltransferase